MNLTICDDRSFYSDESILILEASGVHFYYCHIPRSNALFCSISFEILGLNEHTRDGQK